MIEAVFKKKSIWNMVTLLCGLFLIGLFIFLGYVDSEATVSTLLTGIVFGLIICVFSVICLFFNFKAHLLIDNGYIKGRYHYFGKIDCHISDADFALWQTNTLFIQLKGGKCHTIVGIENPFVLCSEILRNMTFQADASPKEMIESLDILKSEKKKYMIQVCFGLALMFINIFITVFLTGEKELNEFSTIDWIIFAVMCAVEVAIIGVTFYFAQKAGKCNIPIHKQKYAIRRAIIETESLLPGNVLKVFADENYIGRITLFGFPNSNSVYYTVEEYASDYNLDKVYESEIYEDVEQISTGLEALIDITEKVVRV